MEEDGWKRRVSKVLEPRLSKARIEDKVPDAMTYQPLGKRQKPIRFGVCRIHEDGATLVIS